MSAKERKALRLTGTGQLLGTPAYFAPEQLEGGEVTPATDIYAMGVVIYEMVTGALPFTASTPFLTALKRASEAGVIIVAVSQCQEGSVSLGRYAAGSALAEVGVLSGFDMTTEAAFTKLHALFALGLDRARVAEFMPQNLCGELTAS